MVHGEVQRTEKISRGTTSRDEPARTRIRDVGMRRFAPLLTLLAVFVLGGALIALNTLGDPGNENGQPRAAADAAGATVAPAAAAPATSAPAAAAAPAPAAPAAAQKAYAGRSSGNEVTVAIA